MPGWQADNRTPDEGGEDSVVMLLAGPPSRVNAWFTSLQMDSRFRVNTFSTDPQDLESKMGYNPEAVLVDATIFSGPETLMQFLTRTSSAVYVVLPKEAGDETRKAVSDLPSVHGVYLNDVNLAQAAGRIFSEVTALRNQAPHMASPGKGYRTERISGGLRVITVWSRTGGSGKSTIATALALEAAQRGIKTLLVGLGVPDISLPTFLNLKTTPNLFGWLASPTFETGIKPNVQSRGMLDVLVGLQDGIKEGELSKLPEDPASINQLVINATFGGYSIVILDTPVSGAYFNAISSSNTMIMVSTPMIDQAVASAEAYRMAFKRMRDQHRIGVGNVFVVINRFRPGLLSSNEWHEAADAYTQTMGIGHFPPVAEVIPDVPEVAIAANAGRSVLTAGEEFAAPIHRLGDVLYGGGSGTSSHEDRRVLKFGPIRIRKGTVGA
ncbi:MAG TPA: ParA family protein [Pelolinea sp.]|nr:ParA family protein [Pelolinea sp.]